MIRTTAVSLALLIGMAGAAAAETPLERDMKRMEEIARGAAEQFIGTMQQMLEQVPQYGLPEMTENGDIILRRKRDEAPPAPAPRREDPRDSTTSI